MTMNARSWKRALLGALAVLTACMLTACKGGSSSDVDAQPTPTPTPEIKTARIAAVGDIMCHGPQYRDAYDSETKTYDFKPCFSEIKSYLQDADLTIGNLETTLNGPEKGYSGYPLFNTPDSILDALKDAGFDVLTTANNHSLDTRYEGLVRTLDKLDEYGFDHTGTFRNKTEREENLLIKDVNGIKFGIIAATDSSNIGTSSAPEADQSSVINMLSIEKMRTDIQKLRDNGAEVVIVMMHWGPEYVRQPSDGMVENAEAIIKVGADVILGSHPHVLEPIQKITVQRDDGSTAEGLVVYSMGNFVSNQDPPYKDTGMIVYLDFEKEGNNIRLVGRSYLPTIVYKYKNSAGSYVGYRILPVGKYKNDESLRANLKGDYTTRINNSWNQSVELIGTEIATPLDH